MGDIAAFLDTLDVVLLSLKELRNVNSGGVVEMAYLTLDDQISRNQNQIKIHSLVQAFAHENPLNMDGPGHQ